MIQLSDKTRISLTIATIISVVLFIIYTTITLTRDRIEVSNQIQTLIEAQKLDRADIDKLKISDISKDIVLAQINVKLANIEILLVDLKNRIR
jgi:hypothetical protein